MPLMVSLSNRTDVSGIGRDIIDAIWNSLAEILVDEVVHLDLVGASCLAVVAAGVLVVADQFLRFRVDRDHRMTDDWRPGIPRPWR